MKPETEAELGFAGKRLAAAQQALEREHWSEAGRAAYLAALTACRALVFEYLGKGPKSHLGVKALSHGLVRDRSMAAITHLGVLDTGYSVKTVADYGDPDEVSALTARGIVSDAGSLITEIETVLNSAPPSP
jgi:uncharacterized protein (UPF0332 family)